MVTRSPVGQDQVHQPREELHREVFEGERRSAEELEHPGIRRELDERRHGRMPEGVVGLPRHAGELSRRDRARRERGDHLGRDLGIGTPGERRDPRRFERRPRPRTQSSPSRASPASVTSMKPSGVASPRVEMYCTSRPNRIHDSSAPPGCGRIAPGVTQAIDFPDFPGGGPSAAVADRIMARPRLYKEGRCDCAARRRPACARSNLRHQIDFIGFFLCAMAGLVPAAPIIWHRRASLWRSPGRAGDDGCRS